MKTFATIAAGLLIATAAMADTISSAGSLTGVPVNFNATIGSNGDNGTPFWNNNSIDGLYMNAGDFLTGSNAGMGTTDYLGTGLGTYLSSGGPSPDAASFTFLQSAVTVQSTLLYTNDPYNYSFTAYGMVGTQIGLYNVANPGQTVTLYSAGTLWNPAAPNGVYNNNVTPQSPVSANTWANYGIYGYTCGFNPDGSHYCTTYYSNSALNQATDPNHEHFALFEDPQHPYTYFIAFESGRAMDPYEGYGDFNDVIFKLQTTQNQTFDSTGIGTATVPEPATFSVLGLGLAGLGLLRRRATIKTAKNN